MSFCRLLMQLRQIDDECQAMASCLKLQTRLRSKVKSLAFELLNLKHGGRRGSNRYNLKQQLHN